MDKLFKSIMKPKTGITIGFLITVISFFNTMDTAENQIGWIIGIPLIGFYAAAIGLWKPFKKE